METRGAQTKEPMESWWIYTEKQLITLSSSEYFYCGLPITISGCRIRRMRNTKTKPEMAIELKAAVDMVKKEITSGHIPRKAAFEVHACAVWTWSEGKHAGIINELYL